MSKYRYALILALPVASVFRGLGGVATTLTNTLNGMGLETDTPDLLTISLPVTLTTNRKLDSAERAKVVAAVEQQYAHTGAMVTDFGLQGEDDTTPDEAPVNASGATAEDFDDTDAGDDLNGDPDPVQFAQGEKLAQDGQPLPYDASPSLCEGFNSVPKPGEATTPQGVASQPVTPPEPGQENHGSAPQAGEGDVVPGQAIVPAGDNAPAPSDQSAPPASNQ